MFQSKLVLPQIQGRSLVFGDIHGQYHKLMAALKAADFDKQQDRLFIAGDVIDRGPDNGKMLKLITKPWVHSVVGNHELMPVLAYELRHSDFTRAWQNLYSWYMHGGDWFFGGLDAIEKRLKTSTPKMRKKAQKMMMEQLKDLAQHIRKHMPVSIEFTAQNDQRIGVVHAAVPRFDWQTLDTWDITKDDYPVWDRDTFKDNRRHVYNIDAVVMGHTRVPFVLDKGNRIYADTSGGKEHLKLSFVEF